MSRILWPRFLKILKGHRLWLPIVLYAVIALVHYPQLVLGSSAPQWLIGLQKHSFDSILLFIPISYCSYFFGITGGMISLAAAAAIMFPRALLLSQSPGDAVFESAGVLSFGFVLTVGLYMHRRGIAEEKRLYEKLRYYTTAVVRAQEEERKRISRELHDGISQTLIALLRQLDNFVHQSADLSKADAQVLQTFDEQMRQALKEVRHFGRDLRPSILDDLGLIPALEWLCGQLQDEHRIAARLQVVGCERKLPPETELILFRIIQEATRNIAKHSQATQAEIRFEFDPDRIKVAVKDNGIGFKPQKTLADLPSGGKLGLAGMQERVHLLGGSIRLESEPGKGTAVFVEVPA